MSEPTCGERRAMFLSDLIAVCKKHSVLLRIDDEDWCELDDIRFREERRTTDGYLFDVDIGDAEQAIRNEVWPMIYERGER